MDQILGLPPDASAQGPALDYLTVLIHWLMFILFFGWGSFYAYTLVRFRAKRNPKANYHGVRNRASTYVEAFVALVEVILLVTLSMPLWGSRVNAIPEDANAVKVRVVAEQFAWNVHYPGPDGKWGKLSRTLVDPENPLGLDRTDPAGADDIVTLNQLYLPVNRPAVIYLSTKDVIHSFAIPYMRVKQDAIPGEQIPLWFTPVKTTEQVQDEIAEMSALSQALAVERTSGMTAAARYATPSGQAIVNTGETVTDTAMSLLAAAGIKQIEVLRDMPGKVAMEEYSAADGSPLLKRGDMITDDAKLELLARGIREIRTAPDVPIEISCAQLCGLGHYRMRGYVYVQTDSAFARWMADQQAMLTPAQ